MPKISHVIATFALLGSLSPVPRAWAEPARAALIVGNATYIALPGIPGCAKSANTVAAALRALGIEVTERQDASTGGVDAGITEFSQHLAGGPGAGFVYICAYATDFNDRTFVLPTTAKIERPSDVLTQGVLAKALLATVSRDPATVGVVVFDLIPKPDGPPRLGVDALAGLPVPDGVGIVAVAEAPPADSPTPLAAALVSALAGPLVATDALLTSVRTQLATATVAVHMPARPGGILAGPPAVAGPLGAAPLGAAPPGAELPKPPVPVAAAPPPAAAALPVAARPAQALPDEPQMTETDRHTVQTSLARLGYYDYTVDGVFGPETRAAIRRYQHEIGSEMTGRLTADQATRLVNTH